jgi:hypothetical protein
MIANKKPKEIPNSMFSLIHTLSITAVMIEFFIFYLSSLIKKLNSNVLDYISLHLYLKYPAPFMF